MVANMPAENIILSLSQEIPLRSFLTGIEEDRAKLMGVLIASRGRAQEELCEQCTGTDGTAPFESCFLLEGNLEALGCATCAYRIDDYDTIPDRCSHAEAACSKLSDSDDSETSSDD